MMKISSREDFKRLIADIMKSESAFLRSIQTLEDPYDFYQLYTKIIRLSKSYFEVEIDDTSIPFYMKFDLVTLVMDQVSGNEGTNGLIERVCTLPMDSDLIKDINSNPRLTIDVANLACLSDHFETAYLLLEYLHDNIDNVHRQAYDIVIKRMSILLESLSSIIQEKLYNDTSNVMNVPVVKFTLEAMQNDNTKFKQTKVYELLTAEHPEILKTYEQATKTLKRFQTRKSILM